MSSVYLKPSDFTSLEEKYFHSSEETDRLLGAFIRFLEEKDPTTIIQKSTRGATGYTYLCSLPSYALGV